jgi:hypothetical protein
MQTNRVRMTIVLVVLAVAAVACVGVIYSMQKQRPTPEEDIKNALQSGDVKGAINRFNEAKAEGTLAKTAAESQLIKAINEQIVEDVRKQLEAGSDANAMGSFRRTAKDGKEAVEVGGAEPDPYNESAIAIATRHGNVAMVSALLDHHGNPNTLGTNKAAPLDEAVQLGRADIVKLLLSHGADPKGANSGGQSPLVQAVIAGHEEIATALAAAGADINQRDSEGTTPLIFAAINGQDKAFKMLLDKGAKWSPLSPSKKAAKVTKPNVQDVMTDYLEFQQSKSKQ